MRFASAILIVMATSAIANAQQLERPRSLRPEAPVRPLFPTEPDDPRAPAFGPVRTRPEPSSAFLPPSPPNRSVESGGVSPLGPARQGATQESGRWPRSGPVCLGEVPVDPSIDMLLIRPIPDAIAQNSTMRRLVMPECVTLGAQPPR